jgi:CheY-like chemotaxis protein
MYPDLETPRPILLAEDFESDAEAVQRLLKKARVRNPIIVVPDGGEAIAYMNSEGPFRDRQKFPLPAVLLLDLKLPTATGFEILEWCRSQPHLKDLLIVVLSGNYDLRAANEAYLLGAHSVLKKPANREDIMNAIRGHLEISTEESAVAAN